MKILDASLSLSEMETVLEHAILNDENDIRIIGDLELSYEDYKCLALKLKGITKYKENIELFDRYKLCAVVAWVFALRYEKEDKIDHTLVKRLLGNLPQHQLRYVLNLFTTTFSDYGLDDYEVDTNSLDGFFVVAAIHAGIPTDLQDEFFHMMEESLLHQDMTELEEQIMKNLSTRMVEIYKYIDESIIRDMIRVCRELFVDYKINQLSKEEVLNKYPSTSRSIIEGCFKWCEEYEANNELMSSVR
jgi:hypothetical protein